MWFQYSCGIFSVIDGCYSFGTSKTSIRYSKIWTLYRFKYFTSKKFDRQEWAAKRCITRKFMLKDLSVCLINMWWWLCFIGHPWRTGFLSIFFFKRWQLSIIGTTVTVRRVGCLAFKKVSPDMKRRTDLHLIMNLHTIHKLNSFATTFSPKSLIFTWTGHCSGGFISSSLYQVLWFLKRQ